MTVSFLRADVRSSTHLLVCCVCGKYVDATATTANDADAGACLSLQEDEIKALGMGAYMGVAQGAVFPPKFIHLTYK